MRQPFVTARGEKKLSRNLLVALRLANGRTGYGEASESLAWRDDTREAMTQALRRATGGLLGTPIRSYRRLIRQGWASAGEHPTAAAALECALVDAAARAYETCLWCWFGRKRYSLTTDLTLSAWPAPAAARAAAASFRQGFRSFKVKVTGADLDADFQRVAAIRKAAPRAALLLDGNQGFSADSAIRFALWIRQAGIPIRLFEQPVPREDLEGLSRVQREGKIPVVADESVRTVSDLVRLLRKGRVFGVNVKVAKSGLIGALEIARLARKRGLKRMIGCMAESKMGLSHSVALAAGSGLFDFIDLDSHWLTVSPPCETGFSAKGPRLRVRAHRPGSGIEFPVPHS